MSTTPTTSRPTPTEPEPTFVEARVTGVRRCRAPWGARLHTRAASLVISYGPAEVRLTVYICRPCAALAREIYANRGALTPLPIGPGSVVSMMGAPVRWLVTEVEQEATAVAFPLGVTGNQGTASRFPLAMLSAVGVAEQYPSRQ